MYSWANLLSKDPQVTLHLNVHTFSYIYITRHTLPIMQVYWGCATRISNNYQQACCTSCSSTLSALHRCCLHCDPCWCHYKTLAQRCEEHHVTSLVPPVMRHHSMVAVGDTHFWLDTNGTLAKETAPSLITDATCCLQLTENRTC